MGDSDGDGIPDSKDAVDDSLDEDEGGDADEDEGEGEDGEFVNTSPEGCSCVGSGTARGLLSMSALGLLPLGLARRRRYGC